MWHLFLDESGDLGFRFDETDCSRYLTIAVLAVSQPSATKAIRSAVKKTLKRKVNGGKKGRKRPEEELKGTDTAIEVKKYFYRLIEGERFGIYAMTLNKRRVFEELQGPAKTKDRLYNFVAARVVGQLPFHLAPDAVNLTVDRSKGKLGIKDFDSYIETHLHGQLDPRAKLFINHRDSKEDLGLSAADLFSWGVFRRRERDDSEWYDVFAKHVVLDDQYL